MQRILDNPTEALSALDPQRTAALAIHWQVDVVQPAGAVQMFDEEAKRKGLVARAARLVEAARRAGIRVMYSNIVHRPDYGDLIPNNPLFRATVAFQSVRLGTPGAAVIPELAPQPGDYEFPHNRLSAFYATQLDFVLRKHGIDTVLVFGIATNVAVDSTVREGVQLGYNMILVEDCCCSSSVEYHEAALKTMRVLATEVTQSDSVLARLSEVSRV